MKKILLMLAIFLGFSQIVRAEDLKKNIFLLNQKNLIAEAAKNTPTLERIRSNLLNAKFNKSQYLENFEPQLRGDANYFESNEDPFVPFFPTTSPISNVSLGVSKDFSTGMGFGIYNKFNKSKYGSFGTDARNSLSLEFTMDLYRDFFGRDSKSRISYLEYEEKIAQMQKDIDEQAFLILLNRIYFALIFNEENINISNNIIGIYQRQERDANARFKSGIAELSEVKRRSSQLAAKKIDILNLTNKKENLILELKKLLPSIASSEVKLEKYDLSQEEQKFIQISAEIQTQTEIPLSYTYYDDIVSLIEKSYVKQKQFTENYSDLDVEFYSGLDHFGHDNNFKDAAKNSKNNADDSYQIGLRFKAPIGGIKRDSEKIQLSVKNAEFLAKKRENMAKIEAYHLQTIKNLELLGKAQKFQEENSKNLKNILSLSEKKYDQARIPIRDLIEDQDYYLQSRLQENNLKLLIVNQLLDYMTIFTNTPFSWSNFDFSNG